MSLPKNLRKVLSTSLSFFLLSSNLSFLGSMVPSNIAHATTYYNSCKYEETYEPGYTNGINAGLTTATLTASGYAAITGSGDMLQTTELIGCYETVSSARITVEATQSGATADYTLFASTDNTTYTPIILNGTGTQTVSYTGSFTNLYLKVEYHNTNPDEMMIVQNIKVVPSNSADVSTSNGQISLPSMPYMGNYTFDTILVESSTVSSVTIELPGEF